MAIPQLAREFGVTEEVAFDWEAGRSLPPDRVSRTLRLIADFSDAPPPIPPIAALTGTGTTRNARSGTFVDNMRLPIHRWYRYSAGFSAGWVEQLLSARQAAGIVDTLLDPFAGSGTALLAAQRVGVRSIGLEAHSFVRRIAATKLDRAIDSSAYLALVGQVVDLARSDSRGSDIGTPSLLEKCYSTEALSQLKRLRVAVIEQVPSRGGIGELVWLTLTAILRETSGVGTAQWQYVLPNKTKAKVSEPFGAFMAKARQIAGDLSSMPSRVTSPASTMLLEHDARDEMAFHGLDDEVSLIVTSPPYPNNYDYADATRLEMTFWGDVRSWSDLHGVIRQHLICSCSQHSAAAAVDLDELISNPLLDPIRDEIQLVCGELAALRSQRAGKKTYHTMIATYFIDMARVWGALRRPCRADADICFVIGDSAPYGVHVPVDRWLAALAEAAGFRDSRFEKLRDRNLKWKNRKHRVPLQEGRLWLRG